MIYSPFINALSAKAGSHSRFSNGSILGRCWELGMGLFVAWLDGAGGARGSLRPTGVRHNMGEGEALA